MGGTSYTPSSSITFLTSWKISRIWAAPRPCGKWKRWNVVLKQWLGKIDSKIWCRSDGCLSKHAKMLPTDRRKSCLPREWSVLPIRNELGWCRGISDYCHLDCQSCCLAKASCNCCFRSSQLCRFSIALYIVDFLTVPMTAAETVDFIDLETIQ